MIRVIIVGTGNVAQNLFHALHQATEIEVVQVLGRNRKQLSSFAEKVSVNKDFSNIPTADVCLLAVSDEAIATVSEHFEKFNGLVVHTSGGTSLAVLDKCYRFGVFYPLQTFTKNKIVSFKTIPICIEAKHKEDLIILDTLARCLSSNVTIMNSESRKVLHVAAVFVNNFTNYMYTVGAEICNEYEIDFALLQPLICETADKLRALTPTQAQTGPAKRGDQKTLHSHLKILKNSQQRELYTLLSNAIKNKHGKEL